MMNFEFLVNYFHKKYENSYYLLHKGRKLHADTEFRNEQGILLVARGSARLRVEIKDHYSKPLTIRTFTENEVIFVRALSSKLPKGMRLFLDTKDAAELQGGPWEEFNQIIKEEVGDINPIIQASINDTVDLLYRYKAEKVYNSTQRLAVALTDKITESKNTLMRFITTCDPDCLENTYRLDLANLEASKSWDITVVALRQGRHKLMDHGALLKDQPHSGFNINLYHLKRYIIENNIEIPALSNCNLSLTNK